MGVTFETSENEAFTYFIGIFDSIDKVRIAANEERSKEKLVLRTCEKNLFFIKKVELNVSYDFDWSNSDNGDII
jgi:hypothetical protein